MVIKKKTLNLGYWKIIVVKEINSRVVLLDDIGKCCFFFCCIVDIQNHKDDDFCVAATHTLLSMALDDFLVPSNKCIKH
jgi:hypothetical protein